MNENKVQVVDVSPEAQMRFYREFCEWLAKGNSMGLAAQCLYDMAREEEAKAKPDKGT